MPPTTLVEAVDIRDSRISIRMLQEFGTKRIVFREFAFFNQPVDSGLTKDV